MRLHTNKYIKVCSQLSAIIADEKAHKDAKHVKGAGGRMCCSQCRNVHSDASTVVDDYFVSYKTAMPDEFDLHTDASFYSFCDHLSEQRSVLSDNEFEELQKNLGINYSPDSLLFDASLRPVFKPISSLFIDWMHTLVGSGGTGQYHLNGFLHSLEDDMGIVPADVDRFAADLYKSAVRPPNHRRRCCKHSLLAACRPKTLTTEVRSIVSVCVFTL